MTSNIQNERVTLTITEKQENESPTEKLEKQIADLTQQLTFLSGENAFLKKRLENIEQKKKNKCLSQKKKKL